MSDEKTVYVKLVDDLGRVAIPKETRKLLGIEQGDALKIFVKGEKVILCKEVSKDE